MFKLFLAGLLLTLSCSPAYAGQASEIQHLLSFVEHSACTFERNGKVYTSPEAREHIQNKYDYIKDRVKTTEDFIEYAASKSSMSGALYYVSCDGVRQPSGDWLSNELSQYRADEKK